GQFVVTVGTGSARFRCAGTVAAEFADRHIHPAAGEFPGEVQVVLPGHAEPGDQHEHGARPIEGDRKAVRPGGGDQPHRDGATVRHVDGKGFHGVYANGRVRSWAARLARRAPMMMRLSTSMTSSSGRWGSFPLHS